MSAAFKPATKEWMKEVEMSVYVGIDVHKRFCQAALMSEDGAILHELKFENTQEGARNLVDLAKSINPHVGVLQ